MDYTLYKILLWAFPTVIAGMGFLIGMAIRAFEKLKDEVAGMKNIMLQEVTKGEIRDEKIEKIENKIWT